MNDEQKDLEEVILHEQYLRAGSRTTICVLILDTGVEILGSHMVMAPDEYSFPNGKVSARRHALLGVQSYINNIIMFNDAVRRSQEAQEKQRAQEKEDGKE